MTRTDDTERPFLYDRQGKPISVETFGQLFCDHDYKRIVETTVADGLWVSTVWLGIDHNASGRGAPIIFETMVFDDATVDDIGPPFPTFTSRYRTEGQALREVDVSND